MPLIPCFLHWTRHSWNWTVQWNPIYISINLILPLLACWLDFADSCAICCYKTLNLNNVLGLQTASPRETTFWGFLVLWRRPRQRSKDRVAHLNWNSPWHTPITPSKLYSKGQKQVGTRVGLWPNFGWLAEFPDLVAKESIVRDLRIYFVPARRLSLADDWRCTSPSASIQTKWNVTAACPKFIWHSMTGPPCGS